MNPRQIPASIARCLETFKSRLEATGAPRGLRAAKKNDTEGDLFVYEVIGEDFWTGTGVTAQDVAARLEELKGVSRLNIFINSPGGNVWEGKTIFNQLARFASERIVHVDGIAASAASVIAMAGTRIITEAGGTWLVHRVSGSAWGFSEDLRRTADEIDAETISIRSIYEQRTGKSAAEIDAWLLENTIMDAVTAKARGFTDEISAVDQRRADEAAAAAQIRAAAPLASLDARLALVTAQARTISERFPRASLGPKQPGEPGRKDIAGPAVAGKAK